MAPDLPADLARPGDTAGFLLGPVRPGAQGERRVLGGGQTGAWVGRWLGLHLAGLAPGLVLELSSGRQAWPALRLPLPASATPVLCWVFLTHRRDSLHLCGDAAALQGLSLLAVEGGMPPEGAAAPAVHSLARLHALGAVALREIDWTEDPRWPLRATGADPQIRFRRLPQGGLLQVDLQLEREAEPGLPPPTLHWTLPGRGYAAGLPLQAAGPARWQARTPRLGAGERWRLDPLDRPGRFRLIGLETRRSPAQGPLQRLLCWLHDALRAHAPERHARELLPAHELLAQPGEGAPRFLATGDDPHFRLAAPLAAGWYMLELGLELPVARAQARIYLDTGAGEREADSHGLPLRSGQTAKRLLWVPARARLRLDPMTLPGAFALTRFHLKRVKPDFARDRMRRKLQAATGRGGLAPAPLDPALDDAALWAAYDRLFEPVAEDALHYADWIARVEQPALPSAEAQAAERAGWAWQPRFSIVTPTYNTPPELLQACIDSVRAQHYPHWELCLADDASPDPRVRALLQAAAAAEPRIRLVLRERNGHIVEASNSALARAGGDFVVLLDHDDTLAPQALQSVARALQARPQAQIVYSDEDKLDLQGQRCEPHFKPDFNPDLLYAQNYVSHLGVYRRSLVEAVGGFRPGFEGSQDHDLLLRCVARLQDPRDVLHVPEVLYHWRQVPGSTALRHDAKDYACEAGRRAVQAHHDALHPGVQVSIVGPGLYRSLWPLPAELPRVSLIVPTRDGLDVLRTCIESLVERTAYPNYEILVVDNGSVEPDTLAYLAALPQRLGERVRVLHDPQPFNYAALNNAAVAQARGSLIGLINNDVEVIGPDWLDEMVRHALRPEIGCVGAKLYYPDDTVQHAGVILGIGGVADHAHKNFPRAASGYFGRLRVAHNVSAVTAAVLLVRRAVYEQVGGLDAEHLAVAFNDVDFCLKVMQAGYRNLWTPQAELYHHESKTRGADTAPHKRARLEREARCMQDRWGPLLRRDPFYNPNLSLSRRDFSLALTAHQAASPPVPAP
ncbi:glycosyltransferase family 2 protein [Aquariibacter lacus]|nr:glycosyltransferase family 2 protein [Piscinibacter lacus]